MKKKIFLIVLLTFLVVSCKEDNITELSNNEDDINIQEEINSIVWDKLCGRAVYIKKGKYLLMNTNDRNVKIIGKADYFWTVKCNYDNTLITGMKYDDTNNNYNLIATDFFGHQSRLYPSLNFDTPYFDWFPDGRIVYIKQSGQVYIEENALNTEVILPFDDIACSPDGQRILVSTNKYDSDSTHIYFQIRVIYVSSGQQSSIPLCSMALLQGQGNLPSIVQLKVSHKTNQLLFVEYGSYWLWGVNYAHIYMQSCTQVKTDVCFPNWCPIDGKQLTFSSGDPNSPVSSTYWRNSYNSDEMLVIPYGRMIAWFN